jgi:hypothetical protein
MTTSAARTGSGFRLYRLTRQVWAEARSGFGPDEAGAG